VPSLIRGTHTTEKGGNDISGAIVYLRYNYIIFDQKTFMKKTVLSILFAVLVSQAAVANTSRYDSTFYYIFDTTTQVWSPATENVYAHDVHCTVVDTMWGFTFHTSQQVPDTIVGWIYEYDSAYRVRSIVSYGLRGLPSSISPLYRDDYTYSDSYLMRVVRYTISPPANFFQSLYHYDATGHIDTLWGQDWDTSGHWFTTERISYTYDSTGFMTQTVFQRYDTTMASYYVLYSRVFTPTASGQIAIETKRDSSGTPQYRFLHAYDAQGYDTLQTNERYVGGTWQPEDINIMNRHHSGPVDTVRTYLWNTATNSYYLYAMNIIYYGCQEATGILEPTITSIHLYPVPNAGTFTLETVHAQHTRYAVTDAIGQEIQAGTITARSAGRRPARRITRYVHAHRRECTTGKVCGDKVGSSICG
jgi:hypothetical protein